MADVPFFFYGTLCDADVRIAVIGRTRALRLRLTPARARGYRAVYAAGKRYPVLLPSRTGLAQGMIAEGADAKAFARLCAFETGYFLAPIVVETGSGIRPALVFRPRKRLRPGWRAFDLAVWRKRHKAGYLKIRPRVG